MLSLISRYRRNAAKRSRSPSPSPPPVLTKKMKCPDHHLEVNYELLKSGRYSDSTIVCKGWQWKVHQSIVCPRSKFFEVAFASNFREGATKRVVLNDDDPQLIGKMLIFLYTSNYDWPVSQSLSQEEKPSPGNPSSAEVFNYKNIMEHVNMYTVADKFDIEDLKFLAEHRFHACIEGRWPLPRFPAILRDIFNATSASDNSLKVTVLRLCIEHIDALLETEGTNIRDARNGASVPKGDEDVTFQQVLAEDGDLAYTVLTQVVKDHKELTAKSIAALGGLKEEYENNLESASKENDRLKEKLQKAEKQVATFKALMEAGSNFAKCCNGYATVIKQGPGSNGFEPKLGLFCMGCRRYR